jgi:hypothetical protein
VVLVAEAEVLKELDCGFEERNAKTMEGRQEEERRDEEWKGKVENRIVEGERACKRQRDTRGRSDRRDDQRPDCAGIENQGRI